MYKGRETENERANTHSLITVILFLLLSAFLAANLLGVPGFTAAAAALSEGELSGISDETGTDDSYTSRDMRAVFKGNYLELPGEISFKFLIAVPAPILEGLTGKVSFMGETIQVEPVVYSENESEKTVEFSCGVAYPLARDKIALTLYDKDGNVVPLYRRGIECDADTVECSVYEFLKDTEADGGESAELAATMRSFCERARVNFQVHNEIPCDADDTMIYRCLLQPYRVKEENLPEGICYIGTAIVFENMSLRVYFSVEDGYCIEDFDFLIDGESSTPELFKDNIYMVRIRNIPADKCDEPHVVSVNGAEVRNLSVLSQVYNIVNDISFNESGREMYMSLFYFTQAAKAFYQH